MDKVVREELKSGREESSRESRSLREEISKVQKETNDSMILTINQLGLGQKEQLEALQGQFKEMQQGNEKKLEQMRETVDEKLQSTLEKRLGESFKLVGDRLEAVQRGLGEMKNLATGVGDLKKVLTNVKDRGTWGEVQLGAILDQILTAEQYVKNAKIKKGTVEFAVKLPGQGLDDQPVLLPIDSKFPKEDYERLVDAAKDGDVVAEEDAIKGLVREVKNCAKTIKEKYLDPPNTTDFAIMFLPTEGLFAEVLRQPGLQDELQREHRIVVAGPTTLSAILTSLRMGFHTLAIEKRSSEVWQVLAGVKSEFGKFGDILDKVKKQVETVSTTLESTSVRTRAMERKLKDVEALPADEISTSLPDSVA